MSEDSGNQPPRRLVRQELGLDARRQIRIVEQCETKRRAEQSFSASTLGGSRGAVAMRSRNEAVMRPPQQFEHRHEAGRIVAERQPAAMQPRHRGDEAEPQAGTRLVPARIQPAETLHRALALLRRDPGAAIAHADHDKPALQGGRKHDFGRGAVGRRQTVFHGIVEKIGHRLPQKLPAAAHRKSGLDRRDERAAGLLGRGLVDFRDIREQRRQVDVAERLGPRSRLAPRDEKAR